MALKAGSRVIYRPVTANPYSICARLSGSAGTIETMPEFEGDSYEIVLDGIIPRSGGEMIGKGEHLDVWRKEITEIK